MIEPRFAGLLRERSEGILVTMRRDARPQLSNVNYAFDAGEQLIRVSTTDDRAKVRNRLVVRLRVERAYGLT